MIATDGSRWSPSPLRVRPPRVDLEILREDVGKWWTAYFRVSDAETGASVGDVHVQILVDEVWGQEVQHPAFGRESPTLAPGGSFPEGAHLRWNVHSDDYRLASGTERDFDGTGPDRIAEVRLRRGFGARLVLRDAQGRFDVLAGDWAGRVAAREHAPIPGARVLVEGELVATSDAQGLAAFETERPPDRIEIHAPGWTVLGSAQLRDGRIVGEAREILVWLAR